MELDQYCKIEKTLIEGENGYYQLNFLSCDCRQCNYLIENRPIFSNSNCLNHIIKMCKTIDHKRIDNIQIISHQKKQIINKEQINILKNYYNQINKVISNFEFNKILPKNSDCENFNTCYKKITLFYNHIIGNDIENRILFKKPIFSYKELKLEFSFYSEKNLQIYCQKCLREYIKFLKELLENLENTTIIKKYLSFDSTKKNKLESTLISDILGNNESIIFSKEYIDTDKEIKEILEKYEVGPFKITIYESEKFLEDLYSVDWGFNNIELNMIENAIIRELNEWEKNEYNRSFLKFNEILNLKINRIERILIEKSIDLGLIEKDKFILQIAFKSMGFPLLFSFLIDDNIEEIFLDRTDSQIYLDHRLYGRCRSNILLSLEDIHKFITRIRIEGNLPLDEMHPSIKTDVITNFFQVRVTIIGKPLATDDYIIIIRKVRKKTFSILELINNNTLSLDAAVYLIYQLYHKRNIVVIGAPGSGKTTLINALDVLTPSNWRKIYIEDVIESIDQRITSKHQIRISTNALLSKDFDITKENQVRESLHRTPDMIYLGEMISRNSINAFFFLLKVGLRCGLCTSHGEDPELMIKRWMIEDGISINSIQDIDIIVQISKINDVNRIKRRVIRISEIVFINENNFKLIDIFKRDAQFDTLNNCFQSWELLYKNSPVIKKIRGSGIEEVSLNGFLSEVHLFIAIINHLTINKRLENKDLNELLNKFWILYKKFELKDWDKLISTIINNIDNN
ncbi:MAG: ATPase, T2SS/T4P/T4SS family [Candidatus Helarchaeota archaeon]